MRTLPDLTVYLVLDDALCGSRGLTDTAVRAVQGGARCVQLRHKTADTQAMVAMGRALLDALQGSGAALIVNDDADAARSLGAGLHVGQDDMPAAHARALIGPDAILGVSVETPEAAAAIDPALVDYVGAGPVFATATKADHKAPVGWDGLARLIAAAPVPAVAIGGIKPEHAALARDAGAAGIAVVSAICGQTDPRAAAAALHARFTEPAS
ncbi:thiamine phosphate synthase [Meridianimarinicoccus roseus]|uniref:Thiamine-phosphate synthase n=1 Tax=Meridianimarinicoccus roseus TaxID=2072018 RepID=A0A2V2LB14_9RHOB|nr:thiamine phosphate synthase [Meridianimarinicoccus roseus]PWR00861.1 thiamine phosphate synthase [Meridianimarinicoccus roseus]